MTSVLQIKNIASVSEIKKLNIAEAVLGVVFTTQDVATEPKH